MLPSDLLAYAFKILNRLCPINHMFCALESRGICNHWRQNPGPFTSAVCKSEGPGLKMWGEKWAPNLPCREGSQPPVSPWQGRGVPAVLPKQCLSLLPTGHRAGAPRGAQPGHRASPVSQASLKTKKNGTDHSKTSWDGCPRGSFPAEECNSWVGKSRHPSFSHKRWGGLALSCHTRC